MKRFGLTPSLAVGVAALIAWVVFGLVLPVGNGVVHLLLPVGVLLLIRRVVTGVGAW